MVGEWGICTQLWHFGERKCLQIHFFQGFNVCTRIIISMIIFHRLTSEIIRLSLPFKGGNSASTFLSEMLKVLTIRRWVIAEVTKKENMCWSKHFEMVCVHFHIKHTVRILVFPACVALLRCSSLMWTCLCSNAHIISSSRRARQRAARLTNTLHPAYLFLSLRCLKKTTKKQGVRSVYWLYFSLPRSTRSILSSPRPGWTPVCGITAAAACRL